jgi:O-antigen ligase
MDVASTPSAVLHPYGRLATTAGVLFAAAVSVASALAVGGGSKVAVVLPLALAAGVALGSLAALDFTAFVLVILGIRASIDLAKLSGGSGGVLTRLLNPSSIFAVLFIVTSMAWLVVQRRRGTPLPPGPLRRALMVFVATAALSVLASRGPLSSAVEAARIFAAVLMFVVIEHLARDPARMRKILAAAYVSALFPLLLMTYGVLTGRLRTEEKGGVSRVIGPFAQSNVFGRYLMLMIVMGVALYPGINRRYRPLLAAVVTGSSVCLLFTYTRSALVGAVLGLVVVGVLLNRRVLVWMMVIGAVTLLLVPGFAGRFTELVSPRADDPHPGNSLGWRLGYWTEVLPLVKKNPITGIGVGQTQFFTEQQVQPHNDFLRALVETGVVGLGAYLGALFWLIRVGRRAVRAAPLGSLDRSIAIGYLGCAVSFVAASTVSNVFSNVVSLWYFFAFAALASAILRRHSAVTDPSPPWAPVGT